MTDASGEARDPQWIGRHGERVAVSWLRSQGCKILSRNYRGPKGGEIDIIARDGKLLLFVEVKTRIGTQPIRPLDAVDHHKQKLIERGARHWISQLGTARPTWRYDVMEIILHNGQKPHINHVRNAF